MLMYSRFRFAISFALLWLIPIAFSLIIWFSLGRPETFITPENGKKVQSLRMNIKDVERILGGGPRNESTGPLETNPAKEGTITVSHAMRLGKDPSAMMWVSDQAIVVVFFVSDDEVTEGFCLPVHRVRTSFFDRLFPLIR